ncbi:MAG TPA: phasin family protein [Burkholderiales bacterium]|nr:phasin family protein [Burkholderiales bacterium]
MPNPTEQFAAWNQAAYEATMSYARASLASAEQLLRLNLETARATLDQATKATRDLMSVNDPQQFLSLRTKLAQDNMQQAATYAQSVYAIVSQTQAQLAKLFEEQISRVSKDMATGAETLDKGMPGAEMQSTALKSTLAATSAMMDSLNQATRQFAELSENTMKAAAAQMVKGAGKN